MLCISVIELLSVECAEMDTGKPHKFILLLIGVLLDWQEVEMCSYGTYCETLGN